jgi:hypothetical protein
MSPDPRDHTFAGVIGASLAIIFGISCLLGSLFSASYAIIGCIVTVYAVVAILAIAELCLVHRTKNQIALLRITLSPSEKQLLRAHRFYFVSPIIASNYAGFLDYTRWVGIVWAGLALWTRAYGAAVLIAAFFLVAGWLIARLSPIARYQAAAHRGDRAAQNKLAMICHIAWNRYSAFGLSHPAPGPPGDALGP